MLSSPWRRYAALICIPFCSAAGAQGITPSPSPSDTAVAKLEYRSAFDGYRLFSDEAIAPWRDTNDLVGKIGGWRTYAREAADGSKEPTGQRGQSPTPDAPKPSPHAGPGARP
jgi:hypothetical protein